MGMELVRPVAAQTLLDFLGDRVWEKPSMMKALDQFFDRAGPRIVLRREEQSPRKDLIAWCYEQALRHARPLPPVFAQTETALAAGLIEPRWISEASLLACEDLGLGEETVRRILEMFLDGLVQPPQTRPARGAVAAALELFDPRPPASAAELAASIENLYAQHERFRQLRRRPWLAVHQRQLNLLDLARLVRAKLEIAFRNLVPRLDPSKPVLIFGDHGFRLAPDGSGFTHGGLSTLERLTPMFLLGHQG
jgi:hypothetical protein